MYEISLKVKHECPYQNMANIFEVATYSFCSEIYDLFIVPRKISDEEMQLVKEHITDLDSLEIISAGDLTESTYLYFRCMCKTELGISPKLQKSGGIVQEPLRYEDGWEHYKVTCLNEKTQASVLKYIQTIETYELVSIRDLGREGIFKSQFISVHQMLGMITDRQIEVLVDAYSHGYYEIPRNTTNQEIADRFDISRPAIEKSLRKAENSIMSMIIPYLVFHQRIHGSQNNKIKPVELF